MTDRKLLRQVPRHGRQQRRPDAARPHPGHRAGRVRPDARRPGRCRASRSPASRWARTSCRRSAPGVWVEFEQGDPDYPIWTGCYWGIGRRGAGAGAGRHPGEPEHRAADARSEHARDQRPAGADRRIMLKSTTGAMIIVNDTGIYIQNGKGASLVMTGPDGHHQQRRAGGDVRRHDARIPSSTSAPRCCARTAARRSRPSPNTRVLVSGSRSVTMAAPYAVAGCPFVTGGAPTPVRDGAVDDRRRRA